MKAPLREEDLRDAKDFIVEKVADQARAIGSMPNVEAHEKFIAPILRQVEEDHERERHAIAPARTVPEPRDSGEDVTVETETIGHVIENQETGEAHLELAPGKTLPGTDRPAERAFIRRLIAELPHWRERLTRVTLDMRMPATAKEVLLNQLMKEAVVDLARHLSMKKRTHVDVGRRSAPRAPRYPTHPALKR